MKAAKSDNSFADAWRAYHDSFDDNEERVLDTLYASFHKNVQQITPVNLNGTVRLFKELGRPTQAAELISYYIENRGDNQELFDLDEYPFSGDINDPDVIKAFNDKYATFTDERDPATVLRTIAERQGWNPEDLTMLSTMPVDRYCRIFKEHRGQDLRKIIAACLQFDRFANPTEPMKEIAKRAKEALARIGRESPINARRVAKYGL